jgi:hypothetical protein
MSLKGPSFCEKDPGENGGNRFERYQGHYQTHEDKRTKEGLSV